MSKYICNICGYVYDEEKGIEEMGIKAGTKQEDIPPGFVCPLCKASTDDFEKEGAKNEEKLVAKPNEEENEFKELTTLEMSILCSNLAKGCEKRYLTEEQEQFTKLADFFKAATSKEEIQTIDEILLLINKDLEELIPYANQVSNKYKDRGAKRALVWNEKVTLILKSIITRYNTEKEKMFENTGLYVCTICGFIHIGNTLPDVCPVCKVPNYKFDKIEGRS